MNAESTREMVRAIIGDIFELDDEEIRDDTDLTEDLAEDSLKMLELVTKLEKRLDIRFDPEDHYNFHSIGDIVEVTKRHVGT